MPIKYQALGGGGGLTELTIKTSAPNTTITITKENFEQTLVSDETCSVVCKLTNGTYLIKAQMADGKKSQKEIVINNQEEADLRVKEQIKNLPTGAKLKFSSGKKFYLKAKNVSGHESNSATFISEFIIEKVNCNTFNYKYSTVYTNVLPKYYTELNGAEKNAIIYRKYRSYYWYRYGDGGRSYSDKYVDVESYFYIMSNRELGDTGTSTGTNLGFSNDASRIMRYKDGTVGEYWTSDGFHDSYLGYYYMRFVRVNGSFDSMTVNNGASSGVLPACDLKGDTKVSLDTDGYWVITD